MMNNIEHKVRDAKSASDYIKIISAMLVEQNKLENECIAYMEELLDCKGQLQYTLNRQAIIGKALAELHNGNFESQSFVDEVVEELLDLQLRQN